MGQFIRTISGQSGCYRIDPTDPIRVVKPADNVTFTLYNDVNCQELIFTGSGVAAFNPSLQVKSAKLINLFSMLA